MENVEKVSRFTNLKLLTLPPSVAAQQNCRWTLRLDNVDADLLAAYSLSFVSLSTWRIQSEIRQVSPSTCFSSGHHCSVMLFILGRDRLRFLLCCFHQSWAKAPCRFSASEVLQLPVLPKLQSFEREQVWYPGADDQIEGCYTVPWSNFLISTTMQSIHCKGLSKHGHTFSLAAKVTTDLVDDHSTASCGGKQSPWNILNILGNRSFYIWSKDFLKGNILLLLRVSSFEAKWALRFDTRRTKAMPQLLPTWHLQSSGGLRQQWCVLRSLTNLRIAVWLSTSSQRAQNLLQFFPELCPSEDCWEEFF